ncbi:MAG TPA: hypothetical protein PK760_07010, partial [Flavobacteriales bacterium]|nr:hypothetical protein [Flavobacteriales bacterium]
NMQMPLTVTTADEFDKWIAEANKKPFEGAPAEAPAAAVVAVDTVLMQTDTGNVAVVVTSAANAPTTH